MLLRDEAPQIHSPTRICDCIYIKDVVRGMLKAGVKSGIDGTSIGLGTGVGTRVQDVLNLLAKLTGSSVQPNVDVLSDRPAEEPCMVDNQTALERLAWRPHWSLAEGLTETVAWYKSHIVAARESSH